MQSQQALLSVGRRRLPFYGKSPTRRSIRSRDYRVKAGSSSGRDAGGAKRPLDIGLR
jgi:hypothetical protein